MKRSVVALALSLSLGGVSCTGTKGDTGPAGAAGAAGPAGVAGPAGAAGAPGATGSPGATGAAGPAGEQGAPGATGAVGAMGSMGVAGLDGQSVQVTALDAGTQCAGGGALLTSADGGTAVVCNGTPADAYLYGDGSAGPLVITTDTEWSLFGVPQPVNLQFTDITIAAGATLTVHSGLTLRATGTFTNNGTLAVLPWGGAGYQDAYEEPVSPDAGTIILVTRRVDPGTGVARAPAMSGQPSRRANISGSVGGSGLLPEQARALVRPGPFGGGGGGCGFAGEGGRGGGTLVVRSRGTLRNVGTITANGSSAFHTCGGGGAGGVLVLASSTAVENTGTVAAQGAAGTESETTLCGPGGGGSGGLIHFIGPSIAAGTRTVTAGLPGALLDGTTPRSGAASAGGGGGATIGYGGPGGGIDGVVEEAGLAADGLAIDSQVNPAGVFF